VRELRGGQKKSAAEIQRLIRRLLVRRWYTDMLDKRKKMLGQQGGANGSANGGAGGTMPPAMFKSNNALKAQRSAEPSGPPGPGGAPGGARGPPGAPINSGGVHPKIVEELKMQLDSVRELYYNERASQMALSNLVREVQELREVDPILRRIKSLQVSFYLCLYLYRGSFCLYLYLYPNQASKMTLWHTSAFKSVQEMSIFSSAKAYFGFLHISASCSIVVECVSEC